MITRSVSADHVELVSDEPDELLRIARFFGLSVAGIVHANVTIIREGLTDEICYEKFQERARALAIEIGSQRELF